MPAGIESDVDAEDIIDDIYITCIPKVEGQIVGRRIKEWDRVIESIPLKVAEKIDVIGYALATSYCRFGYHEGLKKGIDIACTVLNTHLGQNDVRYILEQWLASK